MGRDMGIMSKVIGIDLGTTNSCVSIMEGTQPKVLENSEGARTTPSVIAFTNEEEKLVGQPAKRQAVTNPENTIFAVKRLIGRNFEDPSVKKDIQTSPFKIINSDGGDAWIESQGKKYSPSQISAFVLQKMKETAEKYLGEKVTQAVITVPAYFNDSQRQATKDAGKIAGLEVLRIINEPTWASLSYGLDRKDNETILVFDLGGGTFDVSILEVGEGVFEVLATSGDTQLGGDDFDEKIVQWLIKEFKDQEGIDLSKDIQALQRLTEAAEKSKIELSTLTKSSINLPFISVTPEGPKHLERELTREKFETLCSDLIARCKIPIELSLKDAELAPSKIAENVLVGGSTRIPAVQELLKKLLGKTPNQSVNPDEVVAIGAAVQAGVLGGEVTDILLLDVTPLSLGVETLGGITTKITPRNTTVPTKKFETFSTAADNQTTVEIHVLQGERDLAKDNKSLGTFKLGDIQPAARGVPQIKVTFDIDTSGILSVTAKDETTNKQQSITISGASTLPQDEVERMVKDAEANAAADKLKSQQIETKNQAEAICYQVKKDLEESKFSLSPEEQKNLNTHVSELEEAVRQDNYTAMAEKIKVIEQVIRDIEQNSTQKAENVTEKGDDVIDAEFSSE